MKRTVGIALCTAVGVLDAGGSLRPTPVAAAEPQQSFRASTQLIEIDVRVTDRDGRFITGLSQDDFDVLEEGRPQKITQFSFVSLATYGERIEPLRAGLSSVGAERDRAVAGRTYVMLLDGPAADRDHVMRMRNVARLFLDKSFAPADQMAVTFVKGKSLKYLEGREQERVELTFTRERREIEAAVDRLAPDTKVSTGVEGFIRTYETLEDLSNRLGAMGGGRKTIVWIGGQVPFDPATDGPSQRRAAEIAFTYRDAIRAANRHNVAINPIDLLGLTNRMTGPNDFRFSPRENGAELKRMAALRVVAEDTGGEAVVGTNNYAEMFAQIANSTSTYYQLGYQASVEHCDGRFHAITVRVNRTGASVRARKGYFAPEPNNNPLTVSGDINPGPHLESANRVRQERECTR